MAFQSAILSPGQSMLTTRSKVGSSFFYNVNHVLPDSIMVAKHQLLAISTTRACTYHSTSCPYLLMKMQVSHPIRCKMSTLTTVPNGANYVHFLCSLTTPSPPLPGIATTHNHYPLEGGGTSLSPHPIYYHCNYQTEKSLGEELLAQVYHAHFG